MDILIRHTEPEDKDELHALLTSAHVVEGTMRYPYMPRSQTQERIESREGRIQLTALSGGEVVGFTELIVGTDSLRGTHAAELNMVAVRSDMQNCGIAGALLSEVLGLAQNLFGLRRVGLVVWTDNAHAIRLYRKYGFEKEGVMRDFVRAPGGYKDALVMARLFE